MLAHGLRAHPSFHTVHGRLARVTERESPQREARVRIDPVGAFTVPKTWITAAIVVGFVAVTALFGGLGPRGDEVAEVTAGTPVDTGMLDVSVEDVRTTPELEEQFLSADDGETLLVARVTLVNRWNRPIAALGSEDRVSASLFAGTPPVITVDLDDVDPPDVVRADGHAARPILQPDVPLEVLVVWRIPVETAPAELAVEVRDARVANGRAIIDEQSVYWEPTDLVGRIRVPVSAEARS